MKKISVEIGVVVATVTLLLLAALIWLPRARPPETWSSLRVGDSLRVVLAKAPELQLDGKDGGLNTWYSGSRQTRRYGILFTWVMNAHFDASGHLVRLDGRSYNGWIGLLDGTIKL